MADLFVTDGDNGSTVSANTGDTLTVQLLENPTTGFRWMPGAFDTTVLQFGGDEFIIANGQGVGGGGVRAFGYQAIGGGSTGLQFSLARAWQPDSPSAVYSIQIDVADGGQSGNGGQGSNGSPVDPLL